MRFISMEWCVQLFKKYAKEVDLYLILEMVHMKIISTVILPVIKVNMM